ncbi:MAG: hypothetical protein RL199_2415, partial [Pseudomonadota bacterium]
DQFEDADGCPDPDNDRDGILDVDDKCPLVHGVAVMQGCPDPDTDGDGIVDRIDRCPAEPGLLDNAGCPLIVEKIEIIDSVQFEVDKDVLLDVSYPVLDQVAKVMTQHTEIAKVRVEGHTDSDGKLKHNMDLSLRRAQSVIRYLVGKGIDEARLTPAGFGPTKPVAPNDTRANKFRNRRVVFAIEGGAADDAGKAGTQTLKSPPTPVK